MRKLLARSVKYGVHCVASYCIGGEVEFSEIDNEKVYMDLTKTETCCLESGKFQDIEKIYHKDNHPEVKYGYYFYVGDMGIMVDFLSGV